MSGTDTLTHHPEAVAQHAIRVLDRALHTQFGVRVPIGAELEFTLHFKPGAPAMQGNASDPLQLEKKQSRNQNTLFPHSRFVQYCYREGGESAAYGGHGAIRQYEAVTDHRHPIRLDQLPRALDQLRHELRAPLSTHANPTHPRTPGTHRVDQLRNTRSSRQAWAAENLEDLRFDSGHGGLIISGLHLNFGVVDAASGENLLGKTDTARTQQLIACSKALFADPDGILFSTPRQRTRQRMTDGPDLQIRGSAQDHGLATALGVPWRSSSSYIENKTPGADCNMHYAVMMQLAAIYDALARPDHAPSVSLEKILDELEPGLGARFMTAERAHPECRSFTHHAPAELQQATQR